MAKKDDEIPSHRFTHQSITVTLGSFTPTPVKQDGGTAAFHDTIGVKAALTTADAKDILKEMGVASTAFLSKLPDEITEVPLNGCHFLRHTVVFSTGGIKILQWDEVELLKFKYVRTGDDTGELHFAIKGIPPEKSHAILEGLVLEAKTAKRHSLGILPPPDGELELEEPDSDAEEEDDDIDPAKIEAGLAPDPDKEKPVSKVNGNVAPIK